MNATAATIGNITTIIVTIAPTAPVSFISTMNNNTLRIEKD
jgi:hypothetical protein